MTIARSGRPVSEVTLDAVRAGEITPDDVRIHPDTLQHQARVRLLPAVESLLLRG